MSGICPETNLSLALLHYPVYNKHHEVVTTAVTNLDLHDIARIARTYGVHRYFVVTPVDEQRLLAERITEHWQTGWGATYNPKRQKALQLIKVVAGLDIAIAELQASFAKPVKIVATGAMKRPSSISFAAMAEQCRNSDAHNLLLFGTGWGLTEEVFAQADMILEPITTATGYNHLSVRSAVAIILDRVLGRNS